MDTASLRELLVKLAGRHRVPGAQVAVLDGNSLVTAEVGEETYGSDWMVTRGSAFPLGSLTKPFTATMAMMLVADGDADLDAPFAGQLKELGPTLSGTEPRMTLRQVLAHTSGLASNVPESTTSTTARDRWVARHCREAELAYRPGTVFSYSNVGYLLAGHLVEALTGMTWWEAMEQILLRPLGIVPSFVVGGPSSVSRPAISGHAVLASNGRIVAIAEQALPVVEAPTGALAASAADLVTFARLHLGDPGVPEVLDRAHVLEMRADQTACLEIGPFGMADGWGQGWALYRRGDRTWFGHDGTGSGTSCHLRFDPVAGRVVAFTANANTGLAMWDDLVEGLRAAGIDVGSQSFSTVPRQRARIAGPAECAGRYLNGETEFTIAVDERGELGLRLGDEPYASLTCFEDLAFSMRELSGGETAQTGRFLRDPVSGAVEFIQISGRLALRHV